MPNDSKDARKRPGKDDDQQPWTWSERMDPEIAGKRWDPDVREGMGKWKEGKR